MVKPKYKEDEFDEEEEVEAEEEETEDEDAGAAYRRELAKKKLQQKPKPAEVTDEPEEKETAETPEEPKNPLTKQEIFDMVQGHLARVQQLLPYLQ